MSLNLFYWVFIFSKPLLTFLKWILLNLKIPKLRIKSILDANTQNFYTSQGFYSIEEQLDSQFVWFEWNMYTRNKKDNTDMSRLTIPFLSKYNKEKHKIYTNKTIRLNSYNKRRSRRSTDSISSISSPRSYSKIFREVKSASPRRSSGKL